MAEIANGTLRDNERVKKLLEFLSQSDEQGRAKDFSALILYVDSMEMQFDSVMKELQEVKTQFAKMQKNPVTNALAGLIDAVGRKIQEALSRLDDIKTNIVVSATQTLESVNQRGILGLNRMAAFFGVHQGLNAMHDDLGNAGKMAEKTIKKMQDAAQELRSVGNHIKNAGRVLAGKERQEVSNGKDGYLATAVLTPMRGTLNILSGMEKTVACAIGKLEHLEQAAEKQQPVQQKSEKEYEVQTNRDQYRMEYLANTERDFTLCKKCLKYYEETEGKPKSGFETIIAMVHDRMLAFDSLTDKQFQAISGIDEPLMAVLGNLSIIAQDNSLNKDMIDVVILNLAQEATINSGYDENTLQEQTDDMEH